ncbi:hypothetical protein CPB84DRAFT_1753199 [Gymnopilus junonius]|uniref:Uncharacterized protein n=1 Tax=Gymnopilus junonius TaxID=109634 RepID=A0A9P5TG66_GYMJU|nr:hypothetical protein CPB84DRAFT_1753199 [Gymnopilus junonius]
MSSTSVRRTKGGKFSALVAKNLTRNGNEAMHYRTPVTTSRESVEIGEVNTSSQLPQRSEDIISLPVLEFQQLIDNTRKEVGAAREKIDDLEEENCSLAEKLAMLEQKLDKEWAKQLKEIQARHLDAMIEKRAEIEEISRTYEKELQKRNDSHAQLNEKYHDISENHEEILDKAHEMTDAYYEQCNKLKKERVQGSRTLWFGRKFKELNINMNALLEQKYRVASKTSLVDFLEHR